MKSLRIVSTERFQDLSKKIKAALSKGAIVTSVAEQGGDLRAKVTETKINDKCYYGIWEKDLLEGKWHLLNFGEKHEVEPEWNDYINFWTQHGENISPMIA